MTLRTRAVLLGAVLPAVVLGAAVSLVLSWRPRLPDPLALHWGVDGVDRVGSFGDHLLPLAVMSAAICLPAVVLAVVVRGAARRGMVGLSAGMATMMAGLVVGITAVQLDATDATAVGTPGAPIALAVLASVVVGGLATWLAGADAPAPATDAVPADAPRLSLPEGGEAVWTAPLPSIPVAVPIAVIALLLGVTVPVGLLTGDWWTLVFPVLIGALLLVMSGWRVQVDAGGLTLRGGLGWPRYHVPAAEVVRADVTEVRPMHDFGGWGVRVSFTGALGFVTRAGEGLEVERTAGRRVVVTVDRATQAAALLNTVADRARQPTPDDAS